MQHILINGTVRAIKPGVNTDDAIAKLQARGYTVVKVKSPPTLKTMERWNESGVAKATDGCRVEPDGTCPHGHKSWMLVLGMV